MYYDTYKNPGRPTTRDGCPKRVAGRGPKDTNRALVCTHRCGNVFRMTPFEWEIPHPIKPGDDTLENSMTLLNCLWFSIGSVLCAGCEILPK
jgi:hypothetical protein